MANVPEKALAGVVGLLRLPFFSMVPKFEGYCRARGCFGCSCCR